MLAVSAHAALAVDQPRRAPADYDVAMLPATMLAMRADTAAHRLAPVRAALSEFGAQDVLVEHYL
jgi:hypothetical protein